MLTDNHARQEPDYDYDIASWSVTSQVTSHPDWLIIKHVYLQHAHTNTRTLSHERTHIHTCHPDDEDNNNNNKIILHLHN